MGTSYIQQHHCQSCISSCAMAMHVAINLAQANRNPLLTGVLNLLRCINGSLLNGAKINLLGVAS